MCKRGNTNWNYKIKRTATFYLNFSKAVFRAKFIALYTYYYKGDEEKPKVKTQRGFLFVNYSEISFSVFNVVIFSFHYYNEKLQHDLQVKINETDISLDLILFKTQKGKSTCSIRYENTAKESSKIWRQQMGTLYSSLY